MYFSTGFSENLKTIILLSRPHFDSPSSATHRANLKKAYQRMLQGFQDPVSVGSSLDPEWVDDERTTEALCRFYGKSSLNDLGQETVIRRGAVEARFRSKAQESWSSLQKLEPQLFELFNMAENRIFFAPSLRAGGGSTSSAIGVLWMHPRESWRQADYLEFMVHELTHTLLFLDERRFQHYLDYRELERPENFALSAILKRPRPLDKVIHSLLVATDVLLYRQRVSGHPERPALHPRSEQILESCRRTIGSLRTMPQLEALVTARVLTLIDLCERRLAEVSA